VKQGAGAEKPANLAGRQLVSGVEFAAAPLLLDIHLNNINKLHPSRTDELLAEL
jgi:hypothetical protein